MPQSRFFLKLILVAASFVPLLFLGSVNLANAQPVSPVRIPPITVTPPAGTGWKVVSSNYAVTYQRVDPVAKQQRTAYAGVIQFKASGDEKAIEAELKANLARQMPAMPSLGKVEYESNHEREYPCVKATAEATQSVLLPDENRYITVPLTMVFFTCRQVGAVPVGFLAGYSYGALQRSTSVGKEAADFFSGIKLDRF
jgi:hypothetical protein